MPQESCLNSSDSVKTGMREEVMRKKNSVTIADIAKKAGVSRTTVSFYINHKYEKMSSRTRAKIEEAIRETDFVPNVLARSLNNKQSFMIGVMVHANTSWEMVQFMDGIEDCLKKNNYQMIVATTGWDLDEERQQIEKMKAQSVDGFIVNPSESFDLLWKTIGENRPLVVYDPPHVTPYRYWVRSNDYEAVYDALERMVTAGYDRLILVTEDPSRHTTIAQRCLAFDYLVGIRHVRSKTIYVSDPCLPEKLEFELLQHIRIEEKTCFFVTTTELLKTVFLVLRRYHDLMPDRIGLIGFDSVEWAAMVTPGVTTIVHPAFEAGNHAARLLLDVIAEKNEEVSGKIFECALHELGSTIRTTDKKKKEGEGE